MQHSLTVTTAFVRMCCVLKNALISTLRVLQGSLHCIATALMGFVKASSTATDTTCLPEDLNEEEFSSLLALELDAD